MTVLIIFDFYYEMKVLKVGCLLCSNRVLKSMKLLLADYLSLITVKSCLPVPSLVFWAGEVPVPRFVVASVAIGAFDSKIAGFSLLESLIVEGLSSPCPIFYNLIWFYPF